MTRRVLGTACLLGGLLLMAALSACSNSQPQVSQVYSQVNLVWNPETKVWQRRLSVFVQVTNADGVEAVDQVHVIHDASRLVFTLTPAQWTRLDRSGETWIGANNLLPPDELPSGAWRLLVLTKAGLQAEAGFVIPPPPPQNVAVRPPVVLTVPHKGEAVDRSGTFRVNAFATDYVVWALAENGDLLAQKPLTSLDFALTALLPAASLERVHSVMLYSYDKTLGQGLEAGPFELK